MKVFLKMVNNEYQLDLKKINLDKITNEEEAFAILLGFNPSPFLKFYTLYKERSQDKPHKLSAEDKEFYENYILHLKKEYPVDLILRSIANAKKLEIWNSSFQEYCQSLHDEGFIFNDRIYKELGDSKNIPHPQYSINGWAIQFYQIWIDKGLWTLEEARILYNGGCPKGGREFQGFITDEVDNSGKKLLMLGYYRDESGEIQEIKDFIQNHIDAGTLPTYGGGKFKPDEIASFLLKCFPATYKPKALFQALDIGMSNSKEVSTENETIIYLDQITREPRNKIVLEYAAHLYKQEKGLTMVKIKDRVKENSTFNQGELSWETITTCITEGNIQEYIKRQNS